MDYHKIPQNVSTFEGRIVGKFTARQFTYLAIGGIIIFILFSTPINTIYRIILIAITLLWSVFFALISFEGRGTDLWIALFSKAIFYPTLRIWKKSEEPPVFLLPSFKIEHQVKGFTPKPKEELKKFIASQKMAEPLSNLTDEERLFLAKIESFR
ncbi:MAG: hypothetical protein UT63_C0082G0004 [Candidatus Gottesmanbacteria bacterium GW2011_GWC2_39_8]|uniref:PrgI family protein n=1 Tax=Candidatus Gottesmanbacteria bacterium GW2011_GWC2_39_8 TaxID=1618450 RepID=A0A0G0PSK2_9BACT|nr:MAG: hypothetical protein UT63_C0082G0004 [Candidatus Gottesmanbacteria bacterium GW2011_GWC2_39_8]